jgi:hypothetical protein
MDETPSLAEVDTSLTIAMRELDAAKAELNKKKKDLEHAVHAFNEASERYHRAVGVFDSACKHST